MKSKQVLFYWKKQTYDRIMCLFTVFSWKSTCGMSTEYVIPSKVRECGSNGRIIPFFLLWLDSTTSFGLTGAQKLKDFSKSERIDVNYKGEE